MRRLIRALNQDVRLQWRNGFYWAVIAIVVLLAAVLSWVDADVLAWLLPPVLLGNLLINGLFFMVGLVMLERAEGSLQALIVTPLRRTEYLAAKLIALALMSLIESVAIVVLLGIDRFDWLPGLLGIGLGTVVLAQFGFVLATRYESVNAFLFPSVVWGTALSLPLFGYFGLAGGWWLELQPLQGPMRLLEVAAHPEGRGPQETLAGVLASVLWIAGLFAVSLRAFDRLILAPVRS